MATDDANTRPSFHGSAFHCPICAAYSAQTWYKAFGRAGGFIRVDDIDFSRCAHCKKFTIWFNGHMIYPNTTGITPPNPDLNDDIRHDYLEAAAIVGLSPRAAAALLRLCIQKLCRQLGQEGRNLNDDIAALVQEGLPLQIQQALDVVRVTGNQAVHPGRIDLTDDRELAMELFWLVNLIAENRITQPNTVQAMFEALPSGAKQAIQQRDT